MSTTRATLRGYVTTYLGDLSTAFTTAQLDAWLDEGHRRLAPVLLQEKVGTVTVIVNTKSIALPAGCVYVLRAYNATVEIGDWREHGGTIYFPAVLSTTGGVTVTVEYLGGWDAFAAADSAVSPLADWQVDVVVFYAVSRAYREYLADRASFKRYSTAIDNKVGVAELDGLANYWEQEFHRARVEARSRRQILYEGERQAGQRVSSDGLS